MAEHQAIVVQGGPRAGIYFRTQAGLDAFLAALPPHAVRREEASIVARLTGLPLIVATPDDWAWLEIGEMAQGMKMRGEGARAMAQAHEQELREKTDAAR